LTHPRDPDHSRSEDAPWTPTPTRSPPSPPDFTHVDTGRRFPQARLVEPTTSGYLLLAAEVDRRPMFLPNSRPKRRLLRRVDRLLADLAADELEGEAPWTELARELEAASRHSYRLRAHNVRRMGPVDHRRQGVFLFNYFYADRTDLNLAAWQYTAGWFHDQTGLDNSTVLLPDATSEPRYRLVNHARWDRLRDVLPSLIFKRSFHSYVLEHFRVNGVAAMPVLYRLA
jgi:hypothetical protein